MSAFDRFVARRTGSARVVTKRQKLRRVTQRLPGGSYKVDHVRVPFHVPGDRWWRAHQPDMAERNLTKLAATRAKRVVKQAAKRAA